MLKRLENKLMMLNTVLSFLKQNRSLWEASPVMVELITNLENLIGEIESLRLLTESNLTGITAEKNNQQEELIDKAYELSSILYAMASLADNKVLQAKVDYTESELQNIRGGDLLTTCTSIAAIVKENLTDLERFEITEDDASDLEKLIASFAENIPAYRVSVTERKAANEKMKELFLNADSLLNEQLDRMMVRYKNNSAEEYTAYTNARSIVNYGIRHESKPTQEAE